MQNSDIPDMIRYGCPLNNLAQEMSPLDEGFRQRLDYAFRVWHDVIQETLECSQQKGQLRNDVNCDETATFIMAALEGCIGIAKNTQSMERLQVCNQGLIGFIRSLQP
ncbi:MAG: TetR family transcriptional regulator C-terminal domain-containing protein [Pseudomonadota bacterium]|nr:TetR family transcriptional regulator C-terminal domain-containing protein [Pseudomonadota bacterium]